jgi:hypothetical protein
MAEKLTFAHSPIHALPSVEELRARQAKRVVTLGRIATTVARAVRESKSKKK